MASKRKTEAKRQRAAQRQKDREQEIVKQVSCRLLGKPYHKPITGYELRRIRCGN